MTYHFSKLLPPENGATVSDILALLSRDFLKLVLAGFLISVPIAIHLVQKWLANFAEQVSIGFGIYFFVGVLALAVAITAVGYQTIQAALANPVKSLKGE